MSIYMTCSYLAEGSVNGEKFEHFVKECLIPVLMPFNGTFSGGDG